MPKLQQDGDKFYIVDVWFDDNTPIKYVEYREVQAINGPLPELGTEVYRTNHSCVYRAGQSFLGIGNGYADKLDKINVPAPKSKMETRWFRGGWQKLYKNGWKY